MKKIFLTLAVLAVAAFGVSKANAGVAVSIGVRAPVYGYGYAAPVYYPAPRVVYVQPAPVVYAAPAYCAPVPVYCASAPVCYTPAPVVRFGFNFGGFRHFDRHGRW